MIQLQKFLEVRQLKWLFLPHAGPVLVFSPMEKYLLFMSPNIREPEGYQDEEYTGNNMCFIFTSDSLSSVLIVFE